MKEQDLDKSVEGYARPAEPRFDDEVTVLSARPVVPLEKINANLTHRRRWFLGAAFALAMMLGAASALLASYLKLRSVPDANTDVAASTTEVSPTSAEVSEGDPTSAPLPVAEAVVGPPVFESVAGTENSPVAPRTEPAGKGRDTVRGNLEMVQPRTRPQGSEEDELQRIRAAVLFDEWQERRARRAARRERRSRPERYNHRDLSNLDEIFEGPRKP